MKSSAILLIACPDQKGVVATISDFVFRHNGNILHADEHADEGSNLFLMRVEFDPADFDIDLNEFAKHFSPIATKFQMTWRLAQSSHRQKMAILVSKYDHCLVDLLYRGEAVWLGNVVTLPVVLAKICLDQFGYNPFFAAPFGVLTYEWKNSGFSLESLGRGFTWDHYRDKIVPTLLATWAVWIPLMAIIYSLPLALQFPLFSFALTFWVLLLTYMTNSFAAKTIRLVPTPDVVSSAMIRPL